MSLGRMLAEWVGFEPTDPEGSTDFESSLPYRQYRKIAEFTRSSRNLINPLKTLNFSLLSAENSDGIRDSSRSQNRLKKQHFGEILERKRPFGEKSGEKRRELSAHYHLPLTIKNRMVNEMPKQPNDYQWILDTYPEIINKEQLYRLCQVSKKTAQHYLENGIIPCVNSGKKTRKYAIRTVDVVAFLKARDSDPYACLAPAGWYKQGATEYHPRVHSPYMQKKLRMALEVILQDCPDVMPSMLVAEVTGYHHETVVRWCRKKKLECFCIRRTYLIPKVSLMEYLTANHCFAINDTAKEHILEAATNRAATEENLPTPVDSP